MEYWRYLWQGRLLTAYVWGRRIPTGVRAGCCGRTRRRRTTETTQTTERGGPSPAAPCASPARKPWLHIACTCCSSRLPRHGCLEPSPKCVAFGPCLVPSRSSVARQPCKMGRPGFSRQPCKMGRPLSCPAGHSRSNISSNVSLAEAPNRPENNSTDTWQTVSRAVIGMAG